MDQEAGDSFGLFLSKETFLILMQDKTTHTSAQEHTVLTMGTQTHLQAGDKRKNHIWSIPCMCFQWDHLLLVPAQTCPG